MAIKWDVVPQETPQTKGINWDKPTFNQSQASLAHSQSAVDKYRAQTQAASQQAQQAASPMTLAKETAKGTLSTIADSGLKFLGSALQAPVDLVNQLRGKDPYAGKEIPGFGGMQKTIQGEFASETLPKVQNLQESPLAATAHTVGQTVGGGLDVLGAGGVLKKVPDLAEKTGGLLEGSGLTKFLSERAASKATSAVQSTVETMTKGEREGAILEGRLSPTLTGGGKYLASDTEKQAGQILSGKVGKNAIKNVPVIQKEIAQRGTEAEQFLGMNGRPISNEEDFQMFQTMKDKASKYLTPEQMKNYDHTINQFQGELKGMGNMNTGTYYKALKNFEQNVTARLRQGNEALLTDSGSAQLQAAKDVRTAVRDMIGQKNPEFKGKMFDLASLYDALDNTVTKASKTDTFSKRFPKSSKAIKYGLEAVGAGALYEGAKKAGLPLPL